MGDGADLREEIIKLSTDFGFDKVGFASAAQLSEDASDLKKWLGKNYHASMQYMATNFDKRVDPSKLVPGAKSVVVFLKNYYQSTQQHSVDYKIAKYAYGRDYHKVIKKQLSQILHVLKDKYNVDGRAFVDSAPVLERALARKAGLGFVGKNTCLINKDIGSFCFISELIIDADLTSPVADEVIDACGNCRKCLDACPTGALIGPHVLDSHKCISYLTIEKNDALELTEQSLIQKDRFVFGCDICQDVCPWNGKVLDSLEPDFKPRAAVVEWTNAHWEAMTEDSFFETFAGTPVMRAGYLKLKNSIDVMRTGKES